MKLYCPKCGKERKINIKMLFFKQNIKCEKCQYDFCGKNIIKMIARFICYMIFITVAVLIEDWKQKIIILICGVIVTYAIEGIIRYIFLSARHRKQSLIENNETSSATDDLNRGKNKQNLHIGYKEQKRYIFLFFTVCICIISISITLLWGLNKPVQQEDKENRIVNYISNQLSEYTSWIGMTSKGKIYVNGGITDSDAIFVYESEKHNINLCIELHKDSNIDIKLENMEVKFYDDEGIYDDVIYKIKTTDTKMMFDFDKVEYKNDKCIPDELKHIVLDKQDNPYIVEAQKYMQQKIFDDIKIIKYNKYRIKHDVYRVEVIGEEYLENKKGEIIKDYKLNLKVTKKGEQYTVRKIDKYK